ncbi:Hypothetical protein BRZCDTV_418 [Brazilian cedratvirus IHUMI]|uniref:Uncharacterized protein n=1 Tax=Brazilian cedratvirus IHUMI TaxID=2126980 RepID=A0A2R8FF28_9VIRU|nr:Hypothetical protein BRZCDTV_418 [Brazilian cedratvirus IHUMI]
MVLSCLPIVVIYPEFNLEITRYSGVAKETAFFPWHQGRFTTMINKRETGLLCSEREAPDHRP